MVKWRLAHVLFIAQAIFIHCFHESITEKRRTNHQGQAPENAGESTRGGRGAFKKRRMESQEGKVSKGEIWVALFAGLHWVATVHLQALALGESIAKKTQWGQRALEFCAMIKATSRRGRGGKSRGGGLLQVDSAILPSVLRIRAVGELWTLPFVTLFITTQV